MAQIHQFLQPLEDILRFKLIPSLTGRDTPGDLERRLMALPSRLGGLGLSTATNRKDDFENSVSFTTPLVTPMHSQSQSLADNTLTEQFTAKTHMKNRKTNQWESMASDICSEAPANLQYSMSLTQEHGASSWLTALPI